MSTHSEAFEVIDHAAQQLNRLGVSTAHICDMTTNRVVRTSSAFYGVGGSTIADKMVTAGVQRLVDRRMESPLPPHLPPRPVQFVCDWCIESNENCQEEILAQGADMQPGHIFGDIRHFVPPQHHRAAGLLPDEGPEDPPGELRRWLPFTPMLTRAWCVKHCK